jgi:excisionase family DNA binding protein
MLLPVKEKVYLVRIISNPANDAIIAALMQVPGVTIDGQESQTEYITLKQAAELCTVNYHTFRKWVIIDKKIPFSRPSGRGKGDIRVRRSDCLKLMEGKFNSKKPGRKSREVEII